MELEQTELGMLGFLDVSMPNCMELDLQHWCMVRCEWVMSVDTGVFSTSSNSQPKTSMSPSTEDLFTATFGPQAPWRVERAELSSAKRRIDFDVISTDRHMTCPHCGALHQGIHERVRRSWCHLDFFPAQVRASDIVLRPHSLDGYDRLTQGSDDANN